MRRTKITKRITGLFIGLLLMALFVFNSAGRASAAACDPSGAAPACVVTANVGAGALGLITSTPAPITVALGSSSTTTLPITAVDDRGATPLGWTVSMTMSQFENGDSSHSLLPTGTASLTGLAISCPAGSCSGLAAVSTCIITVGAPVAITMDGTTSATVCNTGANPASIDQGLIQLNPTLSVAVPFSAVADTYTSTMVVTIVTG